MKADKERGHSFELKTAEDWENMENILKKISGHKSVWYATNIEIYDYIQAYNQLLFSMDGKMVKNPTAYDIWFCENGTEYMVRSGETLVLK